jgi:hypothetical protein
VQYEQKYERMLSNIQGIVNEWIILVPHHLQSGMDGLNRQLEIIVKPRSYVKIMKHG